MLINHKCLLETQLINVASEHLGLLFLSPDKKYGGGGEYGLNKKFDFQNFDGENNYLLMCFILGAKI